MTRMRNQRDRRQRSGGSFASSQWQSETRTEPLNAQLTEKNYEFTYKIAPGAKAWYSEHLDSEYVVRATHGAVIEGSPSQQALARGVLTVRDEGAMRVLRELRLDMITVHDHVLQAQVDRLERVLTYLVNKADGKLSDQIEDSSLREALSRLGYRPTARDLREFSPAVLIPRGGAFNVEVAVDDDLCFEPFTWRLTVHGAYTNR